MDLGQSCLTQGSSSAHSLLWGAPLVWLRFSQVARQSQAFLIDLPSFLSFSLLEVTGLCHSLKANPTYSCFFHPLSITDILTQSFVPLILSYGLLLWKRC